MKFTCKKFNHTHSIISMKGKFTIEDVEAFEKCIYDLINDKVEIFFIDIKAIEHIDSSAIGALIKARNIARYSSIDIVLYNVSLTIHNVFKISHLDVFFTIKKADELAREYPDISF